MLCWHVYIATWCRIKASALPRYATYINCLHLQGQKIAARRGDPHPRAVMVIACGAARRRRPAAIPSGRGRLRGIRADSGGSPHTRISADRLRQPWAGPFPPGPSQSKAGTIHRRCRHSCRIRNPMPRRCTRSRQRFGYSRRRDTAFVMPVADGAATWQASGHPSLLPGRLDVPQVPSAPSPSCLQSPCL